MSDEVTNEVNRDVIDGLTDPAPVVENTPVDVSKYEQQIAELNEKLVQKTQIAESLLNDEIDGREAINRIARLADKNEDDIQKLLDEIERGQQVGEAKDLPKEEPVDIDEKVKKILEDREGEINQRFQQSHETHKAFAMQLMDQALEENVKASEDLTKWTQMLERNGVEGEALDTAKGRFTNRVEEKAQSILRNKRDEFGKFELKWIKDAYTEASKLVGEEVRAMVGGAYDKIGAASDVVSQHARILSEPEPELPDFSKGNPRETKEKFNQYIQAQYARTAAKEQAARNPSKA